MADEQQQVDTTIPDGSPLELSDAAFMDMGMPDFTDEYEEEGQDDSTETSSEEGTIIEETDSTDAEEDDGGEEGTLDGEEDLEEDEDTESDNTEEPDDSTDVDYEGQVNKLLAPFKANGHEIKVDSVDDAITLMQRGANYNKKMAALKPNLKMLKTLENNGLLNEDKLNFLIDLADGNPNAIKKLMKDKDIDVFEMNTEEDNEYSPENHSAGDNEVELDAILERIQDTPTYQRTIDVVTTQWDKDSKRTLAQSPQLIETVNIQMQNGVFDRVTAQVAKEQALGRLDNLSDYDAYTTVGGRMLQAGAFADIIAQGNNQPAKAKPVDNSKAKLDAERSKRKRAAKPARASKTQAKAQLNPLAMSDEEFEKIANSKYF